MKNFICIAAVSDNWIIGKDGTLPWHLPADLQFFKAQTMGHTLIHGRKSHESMGGALPKRRNIVLTSQADYDSKHTEVANSMEAAIELAGDDNPVFILGGQTVFEKAVNEGIATHMIITRVHTEVDGDTSFPQFDETDWERTWHEFRPKDEKNPIDMTFERWQRKPVS